MAKVKSGPLTDEHLKLLNRILESCSQTEQLCEQCASCHLDVDRERDKNREQREIATRIKAVFFPNSK